MPNKSKRRRRRKNKRTKKRYKKGGDKTNTYSDIEGKTYEEIHPIYETNKKSMIKEIIEYQDAKNLAEIFKKYVLTDDEMIKKFLFESKTIKSLGKAGAKGAIYYFTLKDGKKVILKATKAEKRFVKYSDNSKYKKYAKIVKKCHTPKDVDMLVGTDEFVNETIIGYYIDYLVRNSSKIKTNAYVLQLDAFQIGKKTFNVMEIANKGDLMEFKKKFELAQRLLPNGNTRPFVMNNIIDPEIVINIIIQVLSIMHFLYQESNFTHNDLKPQNIFLTTSKTFEGFYDGVTLPNASFTAMIADFGKNSMTIGKNRHYMDLNKGVGYVSKIYKSGFRTKLKKINHGRHVNKYYFKLPEFIGEMGIYIIARHSGLPWMAELDLYVFMCTLYFTPGFFEAFNFSNYLQELWIMLWVDMSEARRVTKLLNKLKKKGKRPAYGSTVRFMEQNKFKFICGMSDMFWNKLKSFIKDPQLDLVIKSGDTGDGESKN